MTITNGRSAMQVVQEKYFGRSVNYNSNATINNNNTTM